MSVSASAASEVTIASGKPFWHQLQARLPALTRLSARFHIAFGLSSLVGSCALMAIFLGVVPDSVAQQRQARQVLAESVTTLGSTLLRNGDTAGLRFALEFLVEQNTDIHGIRLKRRSGGEYQFFADREAASAAGGPTVKTDQLRVPILQRERPWGELVFLFVSSDNLPWHQRYLGSRWAIIGFMGLLCLPLFYLFLGKVLKELNPATAVPSRVRSALDTIAGALLVLDVRGNIVLANAAFVELSGKSMDQLLGQSATSLPWSSKESFVWECSLFKAEPTRHDKVSFINALGKTCTFIVNCSPVITAEDDVGGVLISMDDITQLEKQEQLLRESMLVAEEANSAKSIFLSNMSHEIRTPMTAILGFTDIMKRGIHHTEHERQNYLSTIASSGQHLLELINDVLDLSKVESGALDIEQLPCCCAEIAHHVVRTLQSKADEKSIGLSLLIDSSLPSQISTDPSRLRQIVTNLVGNAIKFTDNGGVTIRLSADKDPESGLPCIHIDVEDTGIGMSDEQQSNIFEAFAQADTTISRRFGGTGLGLSISRQLTEAMHGQLAVHSSLGSGSTFRATLPFNTDDYEWLLPSAIEASLSAPQQQVDVIWEIEHARVLVVDDGAENRQLMSILLSDLGLDVTLAGNGKQGIDALFDENLDKPFDLVFMDIQMSVMDGYQAVAYMREHGVEIPVVALTANAMKGFEHDVLQTGFSHYMVKPIDVNKLGALLADLLGGRQVCMRDNEVVPCSEQSADSKTRRTPCNTKALEAAPCDGEPTESCDPIVSSLPIHIPEFHEVVALFMQRLDEQMQALRFAVDSGDDGKILDLLHWLRGSGGNVGFTDYANLCDKMGNAVETSLPDVHRELAALEAFNARVRAGWVAECIPHDDEAR